MWGKVILPVQVGVLDRQDVGVLFTEAAPASAFVGGGWGPLPLTDPDDVGGYSRVASPRPGTGNRARTVVPPPGLDCTSSDPPASAARSRIPTSPSRLPFAVSAAACGSNPTP